MMEITDSPDIQIVGANRIPRGCMSFPQGPPLHLLRQAWGPNRLLLDVSWQFRWIALHPSQVRCCNHWLPNDLLKVYPILCCCPELKMEGRHMSAFLYHLPICNVVTGKELRLWSCPPAAATESYNWDTTDSLETFSCKQPPSQGALDEWWYYWVLGYGRDVIEWGTRDWYLMHYSTPLCYRRPETHTI